MAEQGTLTRVTMPQLGESVTEGQVGRWLKQPGDRVEKYESLLEVITDKVNAEVPSPVDGVLAEINVKEGETVAVGTLICTISGSEPAAEAGSEPAIAQATAPAAPGGTVEAPPSEVAQSPRPVEAGQTPAGAQPPQPGGDGAGRASPAVRRLASEFDLDLSQIRGTGLGGRVTKKDVEQYIERGREGPAPAPAAPPAREPVTAPAAPPAAAPAAAAPPPAPQAAEGDELIPLTPMRRAIAEHMVRSRHTSPHAWCSTEVDMTGGVEARAAARGRFREREGIDLSYVPFVIKASCEALKEHPYVNATFTAEGILRRRAINISVAVALEDGLIVPVIHNADRYSIAGLAHELNDLATRARAGQLKLDDVEGGTFCVNNPGTFGTIISAPIINQPQAAIMAMDAIVKRPVVLPGDSIGIRSMMFLSLSFDHRVMDGLQAARFLMSVRHWLEAVTAETPIY